MTVSVPASYVPLLQQMSAATGIPYNVEAAQAYVESSFSSTAVSSTGAEGWLQFEPGTYNAYAAQAGVATGTEFNPGDESKVYDVFMNTLLKQEGGNLQNALAAYNAGPGNIAAGQGYAQQILSLAGQGNQTVAGGTGTGTSTSLTSATSALSGPFPGGNLDPLNWGYSLGQAAENTFLGGIEGIGKKVGADIWSYLRGWIIRIGLILIGIFIIYAGIQGLMKESAGATNITVGGIKSAAKRVPIGLFEASR
jgi:hypothetical protein